MFVAFVDFQHPQYGQKCKEVVATLAEVTPVYEMHFKVFYSDQDFAQRRLLGVTWEELPALAFNTLEQQILTYPRGRAMDHSSLRSWFNDVGKGKI